MYTETMFGLYISLFFLGLAAIDPIGLGIMPILLVQKHPYKRAFVFLSGSFGALMIMGLLFAKGLGQIMLHFETRNHWFVPTVEIITGVVLMAIAIVVYLQSRKGTSSVEPSARTQRWLQLNDVHLFVLGGLIVMVQSTVDVVFVVAMVRVGQFQLSNLMLVVAVATYSLAALFLQLMVIGVFRLTPPLQKDKWLYRVQILLAKYSHQGLIIVSLALSCLMFVLAI